MKKNFTGNSNNNNANRRGNFEVIFPLAGNVDRYERFFETSRYNNCVLWAWLRSGAPMHLITKHYRQLHHSVV
jgi:hypothetical protein